MTLPRTSRALRYAACLTLAAVSACGAHTESVRSTPSTKPRPASLRLDEHANQTNVAAVVGTSVVVTLHSTYWAGLTSRTPGVLTVIGTPRVTPGHTCAPGVGCGTVQLALRATKSGSAEITAQRTNCGEARRCVGDEGRYSVRVNIRG